MEAGLWLSINVTETFETICQQRATRRVGTTPGKKDITEEDPLDITFSRGLQSLCTKFLTPCRGNPRSEDLELRSSDKVGVDLRSHNTRVGGERKQR